MKRDKTEEVGEFELELFEIPYPGRIVGKAVVDASSRMIGVVKTIQLHIPKMNIYLIIRGYDGEDVIPIEAIVSVGSIVRINKTVNNSKEVDFEDIIRFREEIDSEIRAFVR